MRGYRIVTCRDDEVEDLQQSPWADLPELHCLASPLWLQVLARAYGARTVFFFAEDMAGCRAATLPAYFCRTSTTLYGLRHGLRAANAVAAAAVVAAAKDFAAASGLNAVDLGVAAASPCDSVSGGSFVEKTDFQFDLAQCHRGGNVPALLSRHGRRSLRTALASGQEVRGGPAVLGDALELYRQGMRRKGVRLHSRTYFDEIVAAFGENFIPLVSYDRGAPVGAAFLLLGERTGVYLYGGSSPRGMALQCGSLLYVEMMRLCAARGLATFDAGESSLGSGTFEFKRRLGARQVAQRYLRADAGTPLTSGASISRLGRRAAALFGRLLPVAGVGRRII